MASTAWSGSFLFVVLGAIAAIGLLGLLLLVVGWRGRRINDHPVCGNCRFDLSGVVPPGTTTTSTARCPECGMVLDQPKSVRVGERTRRPIAIVVGVLLILLSLGSCGYLGFVSLSSAAMNPSKPTLVLRYEARYGGAARGAAAIKELDARMIAGTLSDGQIAALVEQAMEIQADPTIAWLPEWGDLVLTANSAGKLSASTFLQYVRNSASITFECRKIVRVGEPVPVTMVLRGTRSQSTPSVRLRFGRTEVAFDGQPAVVAPGVATMPCSIGSHSTMGLRSPTPTELGPTKLTFNVRVGVANNTGFDGDPDPALSWNAVGDVTVERIAKDQPLVEILRDEILAKAITSGFKFRDLRLDPAAVHADRSNGFSLMIDYASLPAPLSFEVFVRWPAPQRTPPFHEERLGELSLPASGNGGWGLGGRFKDLPRAKLDHVTVILRPSLAVAERNSSVTKTWLGPDLEFPDIRVLDQRGPDELVPE